MQVDFMDIVDIYEKEVKKNTKNKSKIYRFERFKMQNLTSVYNTLTNNSYSNMRYNIFMIKHPKYRIVMSLNIKDKIINHYVTRFILMPKLEKYLDIRNVATRKDMGRDYAINMIKKYLEKFKYEDNCYVLKLDISKYFYSINHEVLKRMIKNDLTDEEYQLLEIIIDSTNYSYINKYIKTLKEREISKTNQRHKEISDIPLYKVGRGLPIGNMSSQFLSIFYLNGLDHKIVHDFKLKYYIRYMDDFVMFSTDKNYLKEVAVKIEKILKRLHMRGLIVLFMLIKKVLIIIDLIYYIKLMPLLKH